MTFAQSLKLPFQAHKTKLVSKLCPLCVHTNSEGNWGDHNLTFALNETKAPSARRFIEVTTVAKRTFRPTTKPTFFCGLLSKKHFRVVCRFRITGLRFKKYVQLLINYVDTRINGVD